MSKIYQLMGFSGIMLLVMIVTVAQLIVVNIFASPFNNISIIFVFLLWLIIVFKNTNYLWLAVYFGLFFELYSSLPFGIYSVSLFVCMAILNWVVINIFAVRSILSSFIVCALGIILFRIMYFGLLAIAIFFNVYHLSFQTSILINIFWEIVLNSSFLTLSYIVSKIFTRRLQPQYIKVDRWNV